MAVLTLALGFVAPAWAVHTADPLEEFYAQHVLPFYKIDAGWQSFAIFADTSFNDPKGNIHLFFFDKSCNLQRDHIVSLTENDVAVVQLSTLAGLPPEGVIFADTGVFAGSSDANKFNKRFLAYMVLVNPADNTVTRIDSIPFSLSLNDVNNTGHWTRYDPFNTIAATFGDGRGVAGAPASTSAMQTTLLFFNALGGGFAAGLPTTIGSTDTLREFMNRYGRPRAGDWLTTGGSATANVTAGLLELDAFDADENFLGSFRLAPRCFERVRLGAPLGTAPDISPALIPVLTNLPLGHVVAFSLVDAQRIGTATVPACGPSGRCAFSGFQETTVEGGAVDAIFSGYFHHSSASSGNSQPLRPEF
jgi:hypothetical protein